MINLKLPASVKLGIAATALAAATASGAKVTSMHYEQVLATKRAEISEAKISASRAARKLEITQLELAGAALVANSAAHKKIRILTREITTEVIKYVQDPTITRCELSPQFVRIHNSAAGGMSEDTGASSGTDGTAGRITDAEVLEVVTTNYSICATNTQNLIALQNWAASLKSLSSERD